MSRPKRMVWLAGVAVVLLVARPTSSEEILVEHSVPSQCPHAIFTYTTSVGEQFSLPGQDGSITVTINVTDTMPLPDEVLLTQTVVPGWSSYAVISSTLLTDDSWDEIRRALGPGQKPIQTHTVVHLNMDEGEDFIVTFENTCIPEPATFALAGGALGALWIARRRRPRR